MGELLKAVLRHLPSTLHQLSLKNQLFFISLCLEALTTLYLGLECWVGYGPCPMFECVSTYKAMWPKYNLARQAHPLRRKCSKQDT